MTRPAKDTTKTALTREQMLALLQGDDAMRSLVQTIVQEVLEAEMDEAPGATKGERTGERRGYLNMEPLLELLKKPASDRKAAGERGEADRLPLRPHRSIHEWEGASPPPHPGRAPRPEGPRSIHEWEGASPPPLNSPQKSSYPRQAINPRALFC